MNRQGSEYVKLQKVQESARNELVSLVADVSKASSRPSLMLELRSCRRIERRKKITNRITWLFKLLFTRDAA